MSFALPLDQAVPIDDVAARLRLIKTSLTDLGVIGVMLTGSTAVYLHAFARENGVPPREVAYILCDVMFPREYIGILMLTNASLHHKVTAINKLKQELKRSDRALFTVIAIRGLCRTSTLVDDHGEEYKVLEGIYLVISLIHAYHLTKSTWRKNSPTEMKKMTTTVFTLMIHCIHSLIFAGCPSLQYGFVARKETQALSLDQKERLRLLSDDKINSAAEALRWFGTSSPFDETTCSLTDVTEHVSEGQGIADRVQQSLENLQNVIKELVLTAHSLEHRTSMPSAFLSSFTPVSRQQL
ncbi:hypothetical protein JCM5353_005459 [Sporobolomyces roseus]